MVLFRHRAGSLQRRIAPRVPAETLQLLQVAPGHIGCGPIRVSLQQGDGLAHHGGILAVEHGHQPELTPGLQRFRRNPATLQAASAQQERPLIASKGSGLVSPDLAAELIEQQHQGQGTGGFRLPGLQFSGDRLLHQVPEPLTHARIKAVAAAKPLPGSALLEPEREDGLMHAVALRLSGSAGSRRCCG